MFADPSGSMCEGPSDFARSLAKLVSGGAETPREPSRARGWHDDAGLWTNLRSFGHWIERSRRDARSHIASAAPHLR